MCIPCKAVVYLSRRKPIPEPLVVKDEELLLERIRDEARSNEMLLEPVHLDAIFSFHIVADCAELPNNAPHALCEGLLWYTNDDGRICALRINLDHLDGHLVRYKLNQ